MTATTARATYLLSVGDGITEDSVRLTVEPNGFLASPVAPNATTRAIQLAVVLHASTPDGLWRQVQDIQRKLEQARSLARPQSGGSGVTLGVSIRTTEMVYFDIIGGTFDLSERFPSGREMTGTLELTALPYARGESITLDTTATLTNPATVWIPNVSGDVDALGTITVTDVSTGSPAEVINRLRISRRSGWNLEEADFEPVVPLAAIGAGTTESDASDFHGSNYVELELNDEWQTFAEGAQPSVQTYGVFHLFARLRDSSTAPAAPTGVESRPSAAGGSLPAASYTHVIVAYEGAGNRGEPSEPVSATLDDTGRVILDWDHVPVRDGYFVYWRRDGEPWKKLDAGDNDSFNHTTEAGATEEEPESDTASALIRAQISVGSTNEVVEQTESVAMSLAGSQWEDVFLGTVHLPPVLALDSAEPDDWLVQLQGMHPILENETLNADVLYLVPADEAQLEMRYVSSSGTPMRMDTQRVWRGATRRDMRTTAVVLQSGNVVASVAQSGRFLLSPGNNQLLINTAIEEGISNVEDAKYTVQVTYTPRFIFLFGAD